MTSFGSVATVALLLALSASLGCKRTAPATTASTVDAGSGVQLWPGITEETTPSPLAIAWTATWLNGGFALEPGKLPGHKVREPASCADLEGVAETDVVLGPGWEHYNFREKSVRCRVMGRLRTATAARAGYVRDLVTSDDPGDVLPAAVAPAPGASAVAGRTWRAVDPTLKFDRDGARAGFHELIVHGAYRGRLTWWAAGDVDGDGLEDVVMFSNLAPSGDGSSGTPNVMRAFVLTRRQPSGPVTIVERFE
jgi:hypothetical protein